MDRCVGHGSPSVYQRCVDQDRLGNPGLSIGTPTFGQITSADDGRIVQLGVKWGWR
jgi:hypothetical protein